MLTQRFLSQGLNLREKLMALRYLRIGGIGIFPVAQQVFWSCRRRFLSNPVKQQLHQRSEEGSCQLLWLRKPLIQQMSDGYIMHEYLPWGIYHL